MDDSKKVEELLSKSPDKLFEERFSSILEKLKVTNPLIQEIAKKLSASDEKNYEFKLLVKLLWEMQEAKYTIINKYELMYKVVKIDNLLQYLLPDLDPESSADKMENYKDNIPIAKMDLSEQVALFRLSKNILGDFSHFLTEEEINYHLTKFTQLCNGYSQPALLAEEKRTFTRLTKTPRLKQILGKEDVDNKNVKQLLSQMGFFLLKSEELSKSGNYYGSYMALISAGNCARFFNICGIDSKKIVTITKTLTDIRSLVEHPSTSAIRNEAEFFHKIIKQYIEKLNTYIEAIEAQAKDLKILVDIRAYAKTANDTSPAFNRLLFANKDKEKAEELEKSGLEIPSEKSEGFPSRGRGSDSGIRGESRGRGASRGKAEKALSSSAPLEHKESGLQRGKGIDRGFRGGSTGRGMPIGKSEKEPYLPTPVKPKESKAEKESPQVLSKEKDKKKKPPQETCKEDELKKTKDDRPDKDDPGSTKIDLKSPTSPVVTGASKSTKEPQAHSGGNTSKEPKDAVHESSSTNKASIEPIQNLSLKAFNTSTPEHKEKKDWVKVSDKPSGNLIQPDLEGTKSLSLKSSEQAKKNIETPVVATKKDETPNAKETSQNTRRPNF